MTETTPPIKKVRTAVFHCLCQTGANSQMDTWLAQNPMLEVQSTEYRDVGHPAELMGIALLVDYIEKDPEPLLPETGSAGSQ